VKAQNPNQRPKVALPPHFSLFTIHHSLNRARVQPFKSDLLRRPVRMVLIR
jgi:hypothetical protein